MGWGHWASPSSRHHPAFGWVGDSLLPFPRKDSVPRGSPGHAQTGGPPPEPQALG